MELWEDAATTYFLGVQVYAFGLYAALGMAVGMIALALLMRRGKLKAGTTPLTCLMALVCGFILSRLFFCLMDRNLGGPVPLSGVLMLTGGGYSMMGAILGASIGTVLSAKMTRQAPAKLLDYLAPALLLFIACERLGEGYIEDFGISRPLVGDLLKDSFLAVKGEYDWRLATYLSESFIALILSVVAIRDLGHIRRAGDTYLLFLMLYGASQVVMESLRFDQHMHLSFVGLQQVMALLLLCAAVIVLAVRRWKEQKKLAVLAVSSLPLVCVFGVALEFAIDRTRISRYLIYVVFALVVAAPVIMGLKLRKGNRHG